MRAIYYLIGLVWSAGWAWGVPIVFRQVAVSDGDGAVLGAVSASESREVGEAAWSVAAPGAFGAYRFTHWTFGATAEGLYRDAWGRALNPVSVVLSSGAVATAHYVAASQDSDGDGVADGYEREYFGDLAATGDDDRDEDGVSLLGEAAAGRSPLFGERSQDGGVARGESAMLTNLATYASYTVRSLPPGAVERSGVVARGAAVETPDFSTEATFGYWELDGVRQADAWGAARTQLRFTVEAAPREAVAYFFEGDSDGDGVSDAVEYYAFGSLGQGAAADGDGDGISLGAEAAAGTSLTFGNRRQEGGVASATSGLVGPIATYYGTYTLRSLPGGAVNERAEVALGTEVRTPDLAGELGFAYWELDGVRQADAWGVARSQLRFVMRGGNREAVAYLLNGDSDSDGVPDAYEAYYLGTLGEGAESDRDGDGLSLLAEAQAGTSAALGNRLQEGGVAVAASALVEVTAYASYTLRSVPEGAVEERAAVAPGTEVSSPDLAGNPAFGYWTLDGVRQADAWGVALTQINFTMGTVPREAVAYLFSDDGDADGVADVMEYYYFGTRSPAAESDADGDGLSLLAEVGAGTSPLYGNRAQEGGVASADSGMVSHIATYAAGYTLRSLPAGAVEQSAMAPPGTAITTPDFSGDASFGYWMLDGERQEDAWGVARGQLRFTMAGAAREAVAYFFSGDSDGDGVADAYEHYYLGSLAAGADADSDGDGRPLLAEAAAGSSAVLRDRLQEGGIASGDSVLLTNLASYASYALRSLPTGAVDQGGPVASGTRIISPDFSGDPTFGFWMLDGLRQADAWGVAQGQISFVVGAANREAVAYFFVGDSDGDGLADAYEQYHLGSLSEAADADSDGDGRSLLAEAAAGTSPRLGNRFQEGGIARTGSGLIAVNLIGTYYHYALSSQPPGAVDLMGVVLEGTEITTPHLAQETFGYWTLDGVAQREASGAALRQISFVVEGADRQAVAHFFEGDSDGDGLADCFEYYYLGSLDGGAAADGDGDGLTALQEYAFGTNPLVRSSAALRWSGGALLERGMPTPFIDLTPGRTAYRAVFARRRDYVAAGLVYRVEFSSNLVSWQTSTATPSVLADDGEIQAVAVPYPFFVGGKKAAYFRVRVQPQ